MSNPFRSSKNTRFERPDTNTGTELRSGSESRLDPGKESQDFRPRERERERERERTERSNTRPAFVFKTSKPTQKIYYEHNNEDFPELVIVNPDLKIDTTLDYKNASLKEEEKPEDVEIFEPGWLYMKLENGSNNILKKYCPIIKPNKQVVSPQQQLNNLMNNVIQKMEERRLVFIQEYGEDNYERDYNIESYYEMSEDYEYYSDSEYYSDGDY